MQVQSLVANVYYFSVQIPSTKKHATTHFQCIVDAGVVQAGLRDCVGSFVNDLIVGMP